MLQKISATILQNKFSRFFVLLIADLAVVLLIILALALMTNPEISFVYANF